MLSRRGVTLILLLGFSLLLVGQVPQFCINRALRSAVWRRDTAAVQRLLAQGADPNARSPLGPFDEPPGFLHPITLALLRRDLNTAQMLTNAGGELYAQDRLVMAAESGDTWMFAFLLRNGAKVDHRDRRGRTALQIARENRQANAARLLVSLGARN